MIWVFNSPKCTTKMNTIVINRSVQCTLALSINSRRGSQRAQGGAHNRPRLKTLGEGWKTAACRPGGCEAWRGHYMPAAQNNLATAVIQDSRSTQWRHKNFRCKIQRYSSSQCIRQDIVMVSKFTQANIYRELSRVRKTSGRQNWLTN